MTLWRKWLSALGREIWENYVNQNRLFPPPVGYPRAIQSAADLAGKQPVGTVSASLAARPKRGVDRVGYRQAVSRTSGIDDLECSGALRPFVDNRTSLGDESSARDPAA
jgi:hypothetical protein